MNAWKAWGGSRRRQIGRLVRRLHRAGQEVRPRDLVETIGVLGPVFCAFGRDLARRTDLLSAELRRHLAAIAVPEAIPPQALEGAVRAALRRPSGRMFAHLEPHPFSRDALFQWHRARLHTAEPVVVKIARPELDGLLDTDPEALQRLLPLLSGGDATSERLKAALAEFRARLPDQIDLAREADALEALAEESDEPVVPAVHRALSGHRILTRQAVEGELLTRLAAPSPRSLRAARRLSFLFLRQAVLGAHFPAAYGGPDLLVTSDDRIAVAGGLLAKLEPGLGRRLDEYLRAVALDEPDAACASLVCMLDANGPQAEAELRYRLRQSVALREEGAEASAGADDLARLLLLHWRLVTELDYRPRPGVDRFFAGVASIAELAPRLAPEQDSLREGFERLRVLGLWESLRRLSGARGISHTFERQATALLDVPRRLDQALDRLVQEEDRPAKPRGRDAWTAVLALLMVVSAVILSVERLVRSGAPGWVEALGAAVVAAVGGLLLRVIGKAS